LVVVYGGGDSGQPGKTLSPYSFSLKTIKI
jgi:hypothetical protein